MHKALDPISSTTDNKTNNARVRDKDGGREPNARECKQPLEAKNCYKI
jgi:hypothetical protein